MKRFWCPTCNSEQHNTAVFDAEGRRPYHQFLEVIPARGVVAAEQYDERRLKTRKVTHGVVPR